LEKAGKEFWSLGQNKASFVFFYLLILFLPTQLGKHFFGQFSFIYGLRIDYLSPTLFLTDILIFLIFIFSIKSILKILLKKHKKNILYFLFFVLFLLIGIVVSKNPASGIMGGIKLLEFIYLGLFIYQNYEKLNKKIIMSFLGFGIIFESLLSLAQYFNQGSFQGILYFLGERSFNQQTPGIANASINGELMLRPYGTFSHPNILSGYILLSSVLILSFKETLNKNLIKLVLIFSTLGIFISFSRVAMVTWIIFLLTYFLIAMVKKYKNLKLNTTFLKEGLMVLSIVLIFFLILLSNSIVLERFTLFSFSDESVTQRVSLINSSFNMIIKSPVFGVGINNFLNNLEPEFNNPILIQPVHNIFLLVFSQIGIIGFFAFMYLFFKSFTRVIALNKNIFIKLSLLTVIILIGLFDHYLLTIQQTQILFTIIVSCCLLKPLKN